MATDEPPRKALQDPEIAELRAALAMMTERLRQAQDGLLAAQRETDDERALHASTRRTCQEHEARAARLAARLEHVEERAARLESLLASIRSSRAWTIIERYRSLVRRVRR